MTKTIVANYLRHHSNLFLLEHDICNLGTTQIRTDGRASGNSIYKKLAVQWLNEALCFVSSSVLADTLRLRNRQLLVAANR